MGRSVATFIKEIGFGFSQLRTGVLVNGTWFADGAEALAISAVATALIREFHIDEVKSGTLTSAVYLGTLIGCIFSGFVGDIFGRRPPILFSYPVIIIFSCLSAASQGFNVLLAFRLFVGLGFGLGQANAITLLVEITPAKWRMLNQGLGQIAFAFGELFVCMVLWFDDPTLTHTNWRPILMWGALPAAVFFVFSAVWLKESPEYLALSRPEEAKAALESMALQNGQDVTVELDCQMQGWTSYDANSHEKPVMEQLRIVFGTQLLLNTLLLCWVCFCYNLVVYGCFFAFPQMLPHITIGMNPVAALALGAAFEIPCDLLGVFFGMRLPRKYALSIYLIGQLASAALFMRGTATTNSTLLNVGYYGLKGFPQIGSVALYVYVAELYPVEGRATGTAIVLGVGRAGAICASIIYGAMLEAYGSSQSFFHLCIILTITSMLAVLLLPETRPFGSEDADDDEKVPILEDMRQKA